MDQKILDKFSEIANNEAYNDEAKGIKTPEEMQKFLASKGLEMSIDDIKTIANAYVEQYGCKQEEELSEEQLETVAGGGRIFKVIIGVVGCACAISIGSPVAFGLLAFGTVGAALGY